jgi:tetratricopeptide (TPR) repeat protein
MDDPPFAEARQALAFQTFYRPRPAKYAVPDRDALYDHVTTVIGPLEPLTCLTFGPAAGADLQKLTDVFAHRDSVFVGFDSATDRATPPDIGDRGVKYVPGHFQNTLHRSLAWLGSLLSGRVLVRCTAPSWPATLFMLTSLWPHCRDYYLLMDDVMAGGLIALHDFSLTYPVRIDFEARYGDDLPRGILARLTRIEFAPPVDAGSPADELAAGVALRELGRLDEADARLAAAAERFPDHAEIATEYGWTAIVRRDWTEALRRWICLRERFPNVPHCDVGSSMALRELGRLDEAESIIVRARQSFPLEVGVAIEYALIAIAREHWKEALPRCADIRAVAPHHPAGYIWGVRTLRALDQLGHAESLLREACVMAPDDASFAIDLARAVEERGDEAGAEQSWREAMARFPDHPEIVAAEARRRRDHARPADAAMRVVGSDADRELVLNFESLGGTPSGGVFGLFQRAMGAEPAGLLRWAELDATALIGALDSEFEGVGEPAFTRVFIPQATEGRCYRTLDTRFKMMADTGVDAGDIPIEQMSELVHQRTRFLRARLIDDLRASGKIFVYVAAERPLAEQDLAALHASMRRYGDNTLFHICPGDTAHPRATVERRDTGLLVGYLSDAPEETAPAHAQLLTLCRQAYTLWTA